MQKCEISYCSKTIVFITKVHTTSSVTTSILFNLCDRCSVHVIYLPNIAITSQNTHYISSQLIDVLVRMCAFHRSVVPSSNSRSNWKCERTFAEFVYDVVLSSTWRLFCKWTSRRKFVPNIYLMGIHLTLEP